MTEAELLAIEEGFAAARAMDDRFSPARQASATEVFALDSAPMLIAEVRHQQGQVLYLRRMMWVMAAASTVAALASIISRL